MFFLIGETKKVVDRDVPFQFSCRSCGKNKQKIFGLRHSFTFFFLPFFTQYIPGMRCEHCKLTLIGKEITASDVRQIIKSKIFRKFDYIWGFILPILIVLLILFSNFKQQDHSQQVGYELSSVCETPVFSDEVYIHHVDAVAGGSASGTYNLVMIESASSGEMVNNITGVKTIHHEVSYKISNSSFDTKDMAIQSYVMGTYKMAGFFKPP